MAHLPSKKVIWLAIVLVVITIGLLWFIGNQNKKDRAVRLAQYTKEFLDKQKNIEAVAVKGLQNDQSVGTPIEALPPIMIATSTASSTVTELQAYSLAVAEALKPLNAERASEPEAVLAAIDKNDPSLLRPVVESRIDHQTAVQNLAQVVSPKELAVKHKKIINQLNFLASILGNMEKATDQPQSALNNSQSFVSNYLVLLNLITDLNKYLADSGVKLSSKDQIQVFVSFSQ